MTHNVCTKVRPVRPLRKRRCGSGPEGRGSNPRLYAGSQEELLPFRIDFKCLFHLVYALARLVLKPKSASVLSAGTIAAYSLTPLAAQQIADLNGTMWEPKGVSGTVTDLPPH